MKTEHIYYKCDPPCDIACSFCDSSLALCNICGAGEGELATECPGPDTTKQQRELTMTGMIDFVGGKWVPKK
jgi:hypothetical protein